jgi:MYXO-CTERM domain-containing protein
MSGKSIVVASLASALAVVVGCSAAPDGDGSAATGTTGESLTVSADDAIARAELWVSAKLPYCQAANHARDYDSACPTYCTRPDTPAWDPYRSDCSGLVSWAWGLPAPGRVTGQLAPFKTDITHTIPPMTLRPGDAVNNSDHVMLFKAWKVVGKTATFIEEPGCSTAIDYAHEFTSDVTITPMNEIHVAYTGMTFNAIRYDALASSDTGGAGTEGAGSPGGSGGATDTDGGGAGAVPEDDGSPPDLHAGAGCSVSTTRADAMASAPLFLLLVAAGGATRRRRRR